MKRRAEEGQIDMIPFLLSTQHYPESLTDRLSTRYREVWSVLYITDMNTTPPFLLFNYDVCKIRHCLKSWFLKKFIQKQVRQVVSSIIVYPVLQQNEGPEAVWDYAGPVGHLIQYSDWLLQVWLEGDWTKEEWLSQLWQ